MVTEAAAPPANALIARNPATGKELWWTEPTPPREVAGCVDRAREAQAKWGAVPLRDRLALLEHWYRTLAGKADRWAELLTLEIGKPRTEALGEVFSTLDQVRWVIRNAPRVLADERLPRGRQRWQLVPPGWLCWRPVGVIGIIGTWNYPLYLNAPALAAALAAGNAVVWKPSELAPWNGFQLQESLEGSVALPGLAQAVHGGPEVGAALIASRVDKGQFTGGIPAGRRVLADLAARGIPAIAELSGFDPAIVLPDAPVASTARAIAWSAFVGAGQTCVTIKRVYVVGEAAPWAEALAAQARALRLGDPSAASDIDVGPLINPAARDRFDGLVQAAIAAGARVLAGGSPSEGHGSYYPPTVLLADPDNPRPEAALAGCFGPVVLVRGVPDEEAAIAAANAGEFGLAASVWGRDRRRARAVAGRIEAGMVAVNDAVTPLSHAAAPFGGVKASGYGRVHGVLGLREYAQPQVVHVRGSGGIRPQLYPYSGRGARLIGRAIRLFHRG